jgi:hypothetical protein
MRTAHTDLEILTIGEGGLSTETSSGRQFLGFNLGFDWCAEHEWGITDLKTALGVPHAATRDCYGLDSRLIHPTEETFKKLLFFKKGGKNPEAILVFEAGGFYEPPANLKAAVKKYGGTIVEPHEKHYDPKYHKAFATKWCSHGFAIHAKAHVIAFLQDLYESFKIGDIVIGLGGSVNPFSRSGLSICIRSRFPKETVDAIGGQDIDYLDLQDAVAKTGIVDRLAQANCRYHACSGKWIKDFKGKTSQHPVIFWLNPMEQSKTNHGWFTVEELDQWIAGQGPIPKSAEQIAKEAAEREEWNRKERNPSRC